MRYPKANTLSGILLRLSAPLLAAYLMIRLEPVFSTLAAERPGVLPVAMVALIGGILTPRVRRWLIVTLCYCIALLAIRDVSATTLPPVLNYPQIERLVPAGWATLAALASLAAIMEARVPGSVGGRRCYFGAASLYFIGHGLFGFLKSANWSSLVLLVTGVIAMAGVFYAPRIVLAENEMEEDEDMRALAEREAMRAARLASREWKDTTAVGSNE